MLMSTKLPAKLLSGLILSAGCIVTGLNAQQCIPIGSNVEQDHEILSVNASPFIFQWNNGENQGFTFSDASQSTRYLSVDPAAGNQNPTRTSFDIDTTNGLGDTTAATFRGTTYITYLSRTHGAYEIVASNNGGSTFFTPATLNIQGRSGSLNDLFTPTLATYNNQLFVAYVVGATVYLGASSDGSTFYQLGEVSNVGTISRPALAVYGNDLVVAFTNSAKSPLVGPVEVNGSFAPNVVTQPGAFGQSNHSGVFAGLALVTYHGDLYVLGQGTPNSQNLYETDSTSPTSFPAPVNCSIQLRFTPSAVLTSAGTVWITYQGDSNTNVYLAESD